MIARHTPRMLILSAVIVLAAAVGVASYAQRTASREGAERTRTAQGLLIAMLDQETGLRGFSISGDPDFLTPYTEGGRLYGVALADARRHVAGRPQAARVLRESESAAGRWRALAAGSVRDLQRGDREAALSPSLIRRRKEIMDLFRERIGHYSELTVSDSVRLETRAIFLTILLVVGLSALFAAGGILMSRLTGAARAAERLREQTYEERQRDLNLGLQVTESEEEAQAFLKRHLEKTIPGAEVVVLKRNNSANRLMPGTSLDAASKLKGAFLDAQPRSCLAIRLAQPRAQSADGTDTLLECNLCRRLETETTCSPLLVGGEVIGSVLVGHSQALEPQHERAIDESVKQAAPVLANLRNLAIAENRAATDGLTGLPNRRAFEETLTRMVAHANRAMSPMAAVALDLDHFKKINDVHGHARGDEVLAEVGILLKSLLRDSDFVARVGGEEFMLLLPDTGRDGALVICERVRTAVAGLEFTMMDEVTASIGVAIMPDDATDGSNLVRAADRMLYTAKDNGRNRVEITTLDLGPAPDEALV